MKTRTRLKAAAAGAALAMCLASVTAAKADSPPARRLCTWGGTPDHPTGIVTFVDTARCFHFGSRVARGAPPRRVFLVHYVTPYAFLFKKDHRRKAPYRELEAVGSSPLAAFVLGAV